MKQHEILKLLGYEKSIEEGAVWEHPLFTWQDKYTWKGETIAEILSMHNEKVQNSTLMHASSSVQRLGIFNSNLFNENGTPKKN